MMMVVMMRMMIVIVRSTIMVMLMMIGTVFRGDGLRRMFTRRMKVFTRRLRWRRRGRRLFHRAGR